MRNLKGKWMNAEAGTEQKMRKGQERDRSGASALDVHLDGYNVKRIGKSRLSRSIGIALAACILVSSPAQAAKTPLISGTESDSDSEADGPALEDGTITENRAADFRTSKPQIDETLPLDIRCVAASAAFFTSSSAFFR